MARTRWYPNRHCAKCSGTGFIPVRVETVRFGKSIEYSAVKRCDCWHAVTVVKKRKIKVASADRKSMAAGNES